MGNAYCLIYLEKDRDKKWKRPAGLALSKEGCYYD